MCTEPTDNSVSGAVILVLRVQEPPLSSHISETGKDSTSTCQLAIRVPPSTYLVNAITALHWVVRISSAHTVTRTISLRLTSRVSKVSMFWRSCMVVAWKARGGKLPPLPNLVDPVLHYSQISMTQKDGTLSIPRRNAYNETWFSAWPLLLVALSSSVEILVVLVRVCSPWWNMSTKLGRSQLHVGPVGRLSRVRTSLCQTSHPSKVIRRRETAVEMSLPPHLDAAETPHLPGLGGQVWFPGATHRAIKRHQKVWMQSWWTAEKRRCAASQWKRIWKGRAKGKESQSSMQNEMPSETVF